MVILALSPLAEVLIACQSERVEKNEPCVDQVWQTEGWSGARMSQCKPDQTGQLVGTALLCTCVRTDGGK